MTQTGRLIRRRFGNRGLLIAVVVVGLAVIAGIIVLVA